jgi:hypothetical protein
MNEESKGEVAIYETEDGQTKLEVSLKEDTVWLTQTQMIDLFQRDQSVISRHINNIFKEGELDSKSNMQKMHIANSDKPVFLYNLDVIISLGCRVKSHRGTRFRIWAAQVLPDKKRIPTTHKAFQSKRFYVIIASIYGANLIFNRFRRDVSIT